MRKAIFRSLGRDENGHISAIERKGFADGTFNYYSKPAGKHCSMWYAIDPMTGLSVHKYRGRRIEVIEHVNSIEFMKKFEDYKNTDKYKDAVNFWYKKQIECGAIVEI